MAVEFYLFDVGDGQSAALKLENDEWCIFDVGSTAEFSPIEWIAHKYIHENKTSSMFNIYTPIKFNFIKATISHLHGDHLRDCISLFEYSPMYLRTVSSHDKSYLNDVVESNTEDSIKHISLFLKESQSYGPQYLQLEYGGVLVSELSLPIDMARALGGAANSRINNTSIVTRIDANGNSILLCGDLESHAWEYVLNRKDDYGRIWQSHVRNVNILIAPHHGHKSGYSVELLKLAQPQVVLISAKSRDPHVDTRYSGELITGMNIEGKDVKYMTTRDKGHIKIAIQPNKILYDLGELKWTFGDDVIE